MKTAHMLTLLIFCPLTQLVSTEKGSPAITTEAYYQVDEAKMEITLCIKNAGGPFCLVERIDAMGNSRRQHLEPTNSKNGGFSVNPVDENGPTVAGKSRRLQNVKQFLRAPDETAPAGPSIYMSTYKTSPGPTSRSLLANLAADKPDIVGTFEIRKIREIPDTGETLLAPAIEARIVFKHHPSGPISPFLKSEADPKIRPETKQEPTR